MQKNLYNLSNPQKEITENNPKKVLTWVLVVLVIVGAGFLVYKKFADKETTIEEKLDVLKNLESGDDGISREQKEEALKNLSSEPTEDTYTEQQKLDALNNL